MRKFENDCLKFLLKIVSVKSLSKDEIKVSKIIAQEMRTLGYDSVKTDKFGNVVGFIGSGKKKILYDAHTDTVGIADRTQWKTDPYKAVFKNGNVYGRGASDDKGCVAAMVYAGALIKKQRLLGDFTLCVSASAREEIGETQWLDFILKDLKFRPDCVVIGEPSDLKIIRGHKGRAEFKLTVRGKSVHASIPHKGINAVYRAADFIKRIELLNKKYKAAELGKPVISVTQVETQNASINTIPDNCSFYIDRRNVDGESEKQIVDEIKRACGPHTGIIYKKFYSAWILGKEHRLTKTASAAYKKIFRANPKICLWPFCTNGSFTMGDRNIPSIGFGPGEEKLAHVANEYIRFADVAEAVKFYSIFPLTFCSQKIK